MDIKDTTTVTVEFHAFGGLPPIAFDIPKALIEHLSTDQVAEAVYEATNAPVEIIRANPAAAVVFTAMQPLVTAGVSVRALSVSDIVHVGEFAVRVEKVGFSPVLEPDKVTGARAHTALATAMQEWGAAVRGDWSEMDGRSVLVQVQEWVSAIEGGEYANWTIDQWRTSENVCPDGGGHWAGPWHGYCETDDGCPSRRDVQVPPRHGCVMSTEIAGDATACPGDVKHGCDLAVGDIYQFLGTHRRITSIEPYPSPEKFDFMDDRWVIAKSGDWGITIDPDAPLRMTTDGSWMVAHHVNPDGTRVS